MSLFGWLTKPKLMVTGLDDLMFFIEFSVAVLIFVAAVNWGRKP